MGCPVTPWLCAYVCPDTYTLAQKRAVQYNQDLDIYDPMCQRIPAESPQLCLSYPHLHH